jgi:hypothetical protein
MFTIHQKLVAGIATPLKNISQLRRIIQYIMENKSHVPNHQPVTIR